MGRFVFEGWSEYYFMLGSSAAALIGLLFVVATLTAGRDRSTVETGSKLFTTPLVCHFGAIVLLSGAALAPTMPASAYGWASGALALTGILVGVRITIGIYRAPYGVSHDWFDVWWYGIIPVTIYAGLGTAAAAILLAQEWAASALALVLMALLLTTIHNAWDLVTFLVPRPDGSAANRQETDR
jgi:cytochrome bd-type quinol oxidase subunit 2